MAVVTLQNVTAQFGTQVVLENISLDLHGGETVGLVGANGTGKTTLFRLISGELVPDRGTVTRGRGLAIGHLAQEPDIALERTLHDEVGSVFAELLALEQRLHAVAEEMATAHDQPGAATLMEQYDRLHTRFIAAGGHTFETRLHEILGGLGFSRSDYELPMGVLSGGQKSRAALAKLLLADPEYLLLDEPTNHLDIDAVRWLEKFLAGHHGGAVVISHDRYLLDRVCGRIVEVDRRHVNSFPGNYTNYANTRGIRVLTQQRQFEKDGEFIRKERDFIAKHLAGQRTREAQGRRTRLERRLKAGEFVTEAPKAKRSSRIVFEKTQANTGTVLRCDGLSMTYGENRLFYDLSFQVHAGDRLGITGPNGTGKTTLLKIILGEVTPTAGTSSLDARLRLGYYGQEHAELDPARSVLDEIRAARPDFTEQKTRSVLGRFLFSGNDVFKTLAMLSGGEQSRVRLATLILQEPEVLILDEPTNHLDIPSREMLEEAIGEFAGTVIVVSHDRYFLDRVVDRLLVLRPSGSTMHAGNYSSYIAQTEHERTVSSLPYRTAKEKTVKGKKGRSTAKGGGSGTTSASAYNHLSLEQLERMVMEREIELAALHERFADPKVCRDPDALQELQERVDAAAAELAAVDTAWQERADAQ